MPEDATGVRAWYRKGNGVAVGGSEEKEREIGCIGASSDSIATDSTTRTVTAGAKVGRRARDVGWEKDGRRV